MTQFHSHTWYTLQTFIDYFRDMFPGPYFVQTLGLGPLSRSGYWAVMDDFGNLVEVRR